MSHAASSTPELSATVKIPFLTCAVCNAIIQANASDQPGAKPASAIDLIADRLVEAELWPEDSELVAEIRAMFMHTWGMDQAQADARMSRLNYSDALSALELLAGPGAIGSTFAGGMYAGIIRGADGAPDQHLVLLDGDTDDVTWEAACAWAEAKGATLPTRAEQRLLMANLPDQFQARYYWSSEQAGPSRAWGQGFGNGGQYDGYRSYEGRARAVRRLPI
ncbi:hypothetical protein CLU92_5440 [Janthinobacterium sp. 61]|uniref:DUF1566 domain-containing protein n=2 Tax=Janthinobacterium sp. 61 TaxID=2035209 RepID=UPI000CB73408|nr:DUF1566 domain-containing protein [Janthinobacterium sp. 61]PKV47965.1 hypothetical protein CLU92_5440 [Janthinobacterium sp. 61]